MNENFCTLHKMSLICVVLKDKLLTIFPQISKTSPKFTKLPPNSQSCVEMKKKFWVPQKILFFCCCVILCCFCVTVSIFLILVRGSLNLVINYQQLI